MQELRIIKRYPNRRLYDTVTSCYITLDEVQDLVLKQIKFKIIDNDTNEDLTSYVLLQIISEQESGRLPFFTTDILENIIRFYGNPLQKNMSQLLEKCFSAFTDQKSDFQEAIKENPLNMITELTKQNLDLWQSTLSQCFNNIKNVKKDNKDTNKSKNKREK